MRENENTKRLKELAAECRLDIIKMLELAGSGHPGGSLSAIDLITTLFFHEMRMDPRNPTWEDRDRFILSKGHAVPALYAVLAKKGAIAREELWTLRKINTRIQGHPDRVMLPVVEASTGSLGQGLSIAQGIALALKLQKKDSRVYCLIGDGESQEGQIWEAAMSAPMFKLNNLVVLVDANNGQIDGHVEQVMNLNPLPEKWQSFRWYTQEIDGHDIEQIIKALDNAKKESERPSVIIARTVKGKGVSFMENNIGWHGVAPTAEESKKAQEEISKKGSL